MYICSGAVCVTNSIKCMAKQSTSKQGTITLGKAWEMYYKKKFDQALDLFNSLLDTDFTMQARYGRACALFRESDLEGALAELSVLIKAQGKTPPVLHTRALVYGANEEYNLALQDLEELVRSDPSNGEALCDLGGVHLLMGNYGEAGDCFDRAVDVDKKCSCAWFGKGMASFFLKELNKSREYLSVALKLEPKHVPALLARAEVLFREGKNNEALRDVQKALSLDDDFSGQIMKYLQDADNGSYTGDDDNGLI